MNDALGGRLQAAAWVFIAFGVIFAAAAQPGLGAPLAAMSDIIIMPLDGLPGAPSGTSERLLAAIGGGVMVGWGVMLLSLGRGASIGKATLLGGLGWFAIDSLGSVLAGAPMNVLGNIAFLALIVWAAQPGLKASGMTGAPAGR